MSLSKGVLCACKPVGALVHQGDVNALNVCHFCHSAIKSLKVCKGTFELLRSFEGISVSLLHFDRLLGVDIKNVVVYQAIISFFVGDVSEVVSFSKVFENIPVVCGRSPIKYDLTGLGEDIDLGPLKARLSAIACGRVHPSFVTLETQLDIC